jgi:D-alanine-D-alanine ligase-like ATP-grasp enzyme
MKESYEFIRDKLVEIRYEYNELDLQGKLYTEYISPRGKHLLMANSGLPVPFPNMSARNISKDKILAIEYARWNKVNTPDTFKVLTDEDFDEKFSEIANVIDLGQDKLIVKPLDSSLSRGLTLGIDNVDDFKNAIKKAREFSSDVVVQRQVSGTEVRFTVLWGEVKSAIVKQKAQVVGNGHSTTRELIDRENEERKKIDSPYLPYPQLDSTNIMREINYGDIPGAGEIIQLGDSSLVGQGASVYEMIDEIDSSYINIAHKLANHLGDGFIAVDVLIDDYTLPATSDNYNFLEFNLMPRLVMYYICRNRNSQNRYDISTDIAYYIDKVLHA